MGGSCYYQVDLTLWVIFPAKHLVILHLYNYNSLSINQKKKTFLLPFLSGSGRHSLSLQGIGIQFLEW